LSDPACVDLLIIGGGINGVGIARDAIGRGLSVMLVEQADLASGTSSASTKLIHGGLRYLELYEFRLVRESLQERERLLALAPHIISPMTFVLPHTPGLRPYWQIRLGLFLYDHIGGRKQLPASRSIDLTHSPYASVLREDLARGFVYSDCVVDDSRLVIVNAVDAAQRGATILTRTKFLQAHAQDGLWHASCQDQRSHHRFEVRARALVNGAGPWVEQVLDHVPDVAIASNIRLVKGSHVVVPRIYDGDAAFLLQHPDNRVIFAIPFERAYTLIGTTDVAFDGDPSKVEITPAEISYLCESASRYFRTRITPADVRWTYAGVRPLLDDAHMDMSKITRDYRIELTRTMSGAPLLSIFGGKITTYRRLAEAATDSILNELQGRHPAWTSSAALPGGDIPEGDIARFARDIAGRWPFLPEATCSRLARAYGTCVEQVLGQSRSMGDLGEHFGAGLTEAEVEYLRSREWAQSAEDVLWRRTKLGLHLADDEQQRLREYMSG